LKVDLDIQLKDGHLLVQYRGPDSPAISRSIIEQIVEACDQHQCYKTLALAYLENSLDALENYDLPAMFAKVGFNAKHRLAWVDLNPDTYDSTSFAETVLSNRGFMATLFQDEEKAMQWLLSD
jgi:hypothetical protein